ncbi:polysaccharide biosynthesis C-terminal domain-containing protein [Enteractinococcus coprophilus]|uniref:UDP-2-acetamido-2,6-beta-L-arabino-hexul-4-ose reductase n=1 Tax=Enteractinococcus coprophilus TaxID=1027633 RepID=A0A543AMP1_9MICC|nr:NAD-dependent epimerase/dehydratase family protein [Enteractinococcus coprophilus]TQL73852.1 UDP-2-acetamido-2,6-beta-L-arabino-hexul-4-ose reductase [Enteractinococcus coprophilus]
MTIMAITGARGFLGFHLRAAAQEYGIRTIGIPLGEEFDLEQATAAIQTADQVIHLAGVNRGTDTEITQGNAHLAEQLVSALANTEAQPTAMVYGNSIQAGNGSVYGTAKQQVGDILAAAADQMGMVYRNVLLPNIFGEYGRPFYNSVVATFSHLIATGQEPMVQDDKELHLLHVQHAADVLLGQQPMTALATLAHCETVTGVKCLLEQFRDVYSAGEFPDLSTTFRRDLFNTYRAYVFPDHAPLGIMRHADQRGAFFEIVRSHGGTGQTSFSTTVPGITRGDHYHRRKVERFTVLAGEAEINLRRLFDDRVFTYRISGEEPKSVDMPTMYTHNIRNVGDEMLYTAFWTNDIFDPDRPDTITEAVTCTND